MKKLSVIDKFVYFVNVVVAVLLLLSYVLPFLPPKTFALLSVLNLGVSFLILLNVLFFLYWLVKLKKYFILSAVTLAIGYFSFGPIYKFSASKNIKMPNNIKVMNYNVRLFNLYHWIPEKQIDSKIVDFVKNEAPEVLSIQEYRVNENVDLSFFKHKYVQSSGQNSNFGQAIFSQFPIVHSGSIDFPDTANNAIFADIVKGKDTIRIYNIHLESLRIDTKVESLQKEASERLIKRVSSSFRMQQHQTEMFLKHKRKSKYKTIICGDFNNTAFSYVYRKIKSDLNDAFEMAGSGFGCTYNFKFLPIRIDFIFSENAFQVNGFKTYDVNYSDHFPIMATLEIK